MSLPARPGAGRLPFLDSLRGIAALNVLLFHQALVAPTATSPPLWARAFLYNGGSGVTLFFVVSAFSLCVAQPDGFSRPGSVMAFYVRRAARILPLFYVMLLETLVMNWRAHLFPHSFGEILRAMVLVFNFVPGEDGGIVPGAWSIGVEAVFYAVFPLIFMRLRSLAAIGAAIVVALLGALAFYAFVGHLPYAAPVLSSFYSNSFIRRLPVFLAGMGAWIVFDRFIRGGAVPAAVGALLIVASLATYLMYIDAMWPVPTSSLYYCEAMIAAGLLLGLSIMPSRWLVNRATLYCGRISYSIYLLHIPMMGALHPVYRAIGGWRLAEPLPFFGCLAATVICVVPVASLSFALIEQPGMRLGRSKIGGDEPSPPNPPSII